MRGVSTGAALGFERLNAQGQTRARACPREKVEKTVGANRADGIIEIEGKVARVATSELGSERVSIDRFITGGKGPYPDME